MATGSENNTRFFNKLAAAARRRPAVVGAAIFATLVLAAARVAILLYFTPAENHMYSESLVRFRYAQMIMDGKAEPRVDYMVQWPEGFRRDEMILWLPDHMVGWSYRGWAAVFDAPKDQYTYLRYFMAAHSALYVPAALLLFGLMFRRFWPAWLAAALYLTCLPTFLRAAGNYLREDFATPPLLAATALAWFLAEGGEASSRRRLWAAVGLGVMT